MLFHPEKKAEKWIAAAELIYLCYYESDDDNGPSLMESVKLLRREGLHTFWFSAKAEGEIEELLRVPAVDAFFQYGLFSAVHLTGSLDQLEHFEDTGRCHVRFAVKECWLRTSLHEKKISLSSKD